MRFDSYKLTTLFLLAAGCLPALAQARKALDIYFIDTEGGHATLYVSPSGESLLMDTGNPGTRDPDRIMAAIQDAGLKQLDYVVLTHYHIDHVGGLQELASRIPIKHFIDHGPTVEPREQVTGFQAMYKELWSKAAHTVARPGDRIPIAGINALVVTSAGEVLKKALPGAGKPNPACADFKSQAENTDPENKQSLGVLFTYGKFRTINLGDFVWNAEPSLMCPNNPIGTVDLYTVSHHGTNQSGSAPLVHGLRPRVAVMDNGTRKGGAEQVYRVLYTSPGLEDLWQGHWSYTGGLEFNAPGLFIANIEDPAAVAAFLTAPPPVPGEGRGGGRGGRGRGPGHTGPAFWIKASAQSDGSFTVTNSRNGFSKTYAARK